MINELSKGTFTSDSLSQFIKENINEIFDYFTFQNQMQLKSQEIKFEDFLLNNNIIITQLDYRQTINQVFIDLLIDACEQLYLPVFFQRLLNIKRANNLAISSRQIASQLYINNIRTFADFENIINEFLNKLEHAYLHEEDDNKRVNFVFFNLYSRILRDFTGIPNRVNLLVNELKSERLKFTFFSSEISDKIFALDITNVNIYETIQEILNTFLGRRIIKPFNRSEYLIEKDTEYIPLLSDAEKDIYSIRNVSVELYNGDDNVFYSLGRGVAILNDYQQLYGYMKSFGQMHFKKCISAFEKLPSDFFTNDIDIIDWGAGQGLASMTYFDFLNKNVITQTIDSITLNEPSELAIKRATLHLKKFESKMTIRTINKDLDSLETSDFNNSDKKTKLHLFSNILDIDDYSLTRLNELISHTFKGENYFIVVSPYITETKKNRIEMFTNYFSKHSSSLIAEPFDKMKDEWIPGKSWSIVLRMFKVNIV